jgi:hypothetical protein
MKNQNVNRALILFVIISMLLVIIPSNNVLATSSTTLMSFAGTGLSSQLSIGNPANNSLLTTTKISGTNFFTVSTNCYRGNRAYDLNGNGYFNLSYSKTEYLTNISFFIDGHNVGGTGSITIFFYNKSYQSTYSTNYIIKLYGLRSDSKGYYYNSVGTQTAFDTSSAFVLGQYTTKYYVSITDALGDCDYKGNIGIIHGTVRNATQIIAGKRIDTIYITNNMGDYYIDEINFTTSTSYTQSGGILPGCIDLTGLVQVGHFAYTTYSYNFPYIIKKYFVPVTTTIKAILLECNGAQLSDDGDLSHYYCYVNGVSIGNPICDYTSGDELIFEWSCTVVLTNEAPVFTFYHSQHTSAGRYWQIATTTFSGGGDLDSDGDVSYYLANAGFTPSSSYPGSYSSSSLGDLGLEWFTTGFTPSTSYTYGDSLGLSYYDYSNATGYVYDIRNPNGIVCQYTLSTTSKAYNCKIELWKNGTQTNDYGFPQPINYPSGSVSISPTTIGKYYFKLYSFHYLKNITAWETGTPDNFQIFINPKTSNQFSNYAVTCRYYHAQGLKGRVAIFSSVIDVNDYSKALYSYPVNDNTSTIIHYSSNASTNEYWQLFALSSTYTSVGQYSVHYVRLPFVFENTIIPKANPIILSGKFLLDVTHTMPGSDIGVYINDIKIASVGGAQISTVEYKPIKAGLFNATLKIMQNGTLTMLNHTMLTVTSPSGGQGNQNDVTFTIVGLIPVEYRIYVGIGVIIAFIFMPMGFIFSMVGALAGRGINITVPSLVTTVMTIFSGITGYILTIMWGLMPWYSVFLLLFVLILIVAIMWMRGGKGTQNE